MIQCRKHPHKSKGAAEAQLHALLRLGNDAKDTETLCTFPHDCGFWHVGHNEMKIRPNLSADSGG